MNWSTIKIISVSILAVACIAFFGLWRYNAIELKNALKELKTANDAILVYEENTIITEEVGNEYQNTIDKLHADIKRLQSRNIRCVPVAGTAGWTNAGTAETKLSGRGGISSEWIIDFAGRCEGERLKVIGLQNFINRIYDSRKKN